MPSVVDAESQRRFVALSGDANPLHVDEREARRTHFERPVVHGVHLALAALERALGEDPGPRRLDALDARFRSGVVVEERFEPGERADITFAFGSRDAPVEPAEPEAWPTDVEEWTELDALADRSGTTPLVVDRALLAAAFPRVASDLPAGDAAALLAMTRVVGMNCPGHWALLRSISFERREGGGEEPLVAWSVTRIRRAARLLELRFEGPGWEGGAQVILRQPPAGQISLRDARALVDPEEFADVRAVVIGGSRGLGEASARLLLAGGAACLVTYRLGREDAERAIAGAPAGRAETLELDVARPGAAAERALREYGATHALVYATPPIPKRTGQPWDQGLFDRYERIYSGALEWLVDTLEGTPLRAVLYPSSVYVVERPAGFAEYSEAKAAGEAVAQAIDALPDRPAVLVERFPVLATDQTAGTVAGDAAANADVLLAALRRLVVTPA